MEREAALLEDRVTGVGLDCRVDSKGAVVDQGYDELWTSNMEKGARDKENTREELLSCGHFSSLFERLM